MKDSACYTHRAKELVESEKAFVTIVSRNVDGYLLTRDVSEEKSTRNLCLVARKSVECDEGYWSSGSEDNYDDTEPNYYYMETNDPPG